MTERLLDSPDRRLTADEQRLRNRLLPSLTAWTRYLDKNPGADSFDEAEAVEAPIVARHRKASAMGYKPLIVAPMYALRWARLHGYGGRPGSGDVITLHSMIDALDFMHAPRVTTFRPQVDPGVGVRRRDGYWRLSIPVVERLRQERYVPVLADPPGRRRRDRVVVDQRVPRLAKVPGLEDTTALLRHYGQVQPVTALLAVALAEGRPLAIRPPGRPTSSAHRGTLVRTDVVLVHLDGLTTHEQEHADALGLLPMTRGEVQTALEAYAAANPRVLVPVAQFSTIDAGQRRKVRGWWRLTLAPLRLREVDPGEVFGEVEHWSRTRDRDTLTPEPARRRVGGFAWPEGFDLQYVDDADYRMSYGVSDEDYERWKETQR